MGSGAGELYFIFAAVPTTIRERIERYTRAYSRAFVTAVIKTFSLKGFLKYTPGKLPVLLITPNVPVKCK
jgi:hypothetical protein